MRGSSHAFRLATVPRAVAVGASLALVLLFGALLFPTTPDAVHAEETTKATLAIQPTLAVTLPNMVNFEVQPTAAGAVTSGSATLSISTNNETGYSLYLSTADDDNALHSINPDTQQTITALTQENATAAKFTNNTWGYNLSKDTATDSTTYQSVPTTQPSDPQIITEAPTTDTYNLTFAAKVDSSLPSGTYTNTVTVSVVTNPAYVPTISEVADMQDVTAETCAASAEGETATLIDTRDGSDYTVAKINGDCWMTQNLRISSTTESGGSRVLTSADSNVTGNWTFPAGSLTSGDTYTEARSILSDDTEHALEYGGYYNYCAASAGTVCNNTTEQDATQDICPKGWRLPTHNEQTGITIHTSAFSPVYSGGYISGLLHDAGSIGRWWSATAGSSTYQGQLLYSGGSLDTDGYLARYSAFKYLGLSVRCIRSNPGTLTINFDGNGSTGGSTASQQIAAGNSASLNANGFTRNGYAFTGWNTTAGGSGTSYADGADYTVTPATGDATVTLYAQWGPFMQDFTLAQCQSLASDANYTVVDSRDGSDYTVRYINGACWMTQNLRLSGGRTLTPSDSDVDSNWIFPNNSLTAGNSYTEARFILSDDPQYATEYGGYYNYCAASAGSVCAETKMDATQSICPAGWTLPTGGFDSQQSGITSYVDAFSPVLSGSYSNGSFYNTGSYGNLWSATAYSSVSQYGLYYDGSSLDTGYNGKYYGFSVRCVRSS